MTTQAVSVNKNTFIWPQNKLAWDYMCSYTFYCTDPVHKYFIF